MNLLKLLAATASQAAGIQYVGGYVAGYAGTTSDISIPLTSLTGGLASAPAANDLVVIGVASSYDNDSDLSITGYTEIADLHSSSVDYSINLGVFRKFMGATPDTTATWVGGTGGTYCAGAVYVSVWRGVDQTTPEDVAAVTRTDVDTVQADPPSITPITPGAVIVAIGGGIHDQDIQTYSSSDLTAFLSASGDDDIDTVIGGGYKEWTSGAFNPAQFTFSGTDSIDYSWAAVTLALRPA